MKRWIGFAILLSFAAGCATQRGDTVSDRVRYEGPPVLIGGIPKMLDNPVFDYPHTGALKAAAELGHVDIRWDAPAQLHPEEQVRILDDMVAQGANGILISCADPDVLGPAIDRAAEQGVPVVTFDSDSPASKRVCFYGVDDEKMGRRLAEEMVRLLDGRGRVAILSGSQKALNLINRRNGVLSTLSRHPDITVINTYYCNDDTDLSVKILYTITPYQKPDGWIMLGGWPLFKENGLDCLASTDVKVVAVDPLPQSWKWIEKEVVQVCLGQKVFAWGEEGIRLVMKAIMKKTLPIFIDSGFDVVTPENLDEYKTKWKENQGIEE